MHLYQILLPYEPMAISIGPYFHKEQETRPHLKQMWHYKWSCLHNLISQRSELITRSDLIKSFLLKMRELEGRIRCSYSEEIRMSSPDLAEMMMLDGCFIFHLVLKYYEQETENVDMNDSNEDWTQVLGRCWIWNLVRYDLLLLENQIPFFVVRELYSIFKSAKERTADILMFENKWKQRVNLEITEEQANDIIELERGQERGNDIVIGVQDEDILVIGSLKLFSTLHPCKTNTYFRFKVDQVHHLLHLIYLSILESLEPLPATPPVKETPNWVPSAKELQETGVQFKKKQDAKSFLDIKFTKGVIEIPPLQIYDYSDSLFRNLIAFEQCYPDTKWHVTAYAAFMDCLINTPDDMRLLHLAGVVTNRMTVDQNAGNFFSSLCSHAHYSNEWNYLRNVLIEVNKYHGLTWHQWRAGFVRDYCSTPWIIISIIVASFLIVLASIQTFFSVYAYFKPPN